MIEEVKLKQKISKFQITRKGDYLFGKYCPLFKVVKHPKLL